MRPLVALVTDFGLDDSYVAEVHLAIRCVVPDAEVRDVTHHLPPYDIPAAALVVERAFEALPRGAALVVVVDPGVGTARARLAARRDGRWCVGPDNGVLPLAPDAEAWRIEALRPRDGVRTFDGREVFGPAAALLAAGCDPRLLGPRARATAPWSMPCDAPWERVGALRYARGVIVALDRYGNAVTSVRLPVDAKDVSVLEPSAWAGPLRATYGGAAPGDRVALVGSSGRVELAVVQGASGLARGDEVVLRCEA